ncbi:hypothetical protein ABDI16_23055, partial [Cytobacillus firmus]|uniref:hypothetical protein n=1 Tax=Cytobacillus firmus TaxID=1399 RepID=UPI003D230CCD
IYLYLLILIIINQINNRDKIEIFLFLFFRKSGALGAIFSNSMRDKELNRFGDCSNGDAVKNLNFIFPSFHYK